MRGRGRGRGRGRATSVGRARGRGRGRGGGGSAGRGSAASAASASDVKTASDTLTAPASSNLSASSPSSSASLVSPALSEPPRRRMITRALLHGTALVSSSPTTTTTTTAAAAAVVRGRRGRGGRAASTGVARGRGGRKRTLDDDEDAQPHGLAAANGSQSRRAAVGGVLRCVCNAFLVTTQETLLECTACGNFCHPACVGVDAVDEVRAYRRGEQLFVCPYCDPSQEAAALRLEGPPRKKPRRTLGMAGPHASPSEPEVARRGTTTSTTTTTTAMSVAALQSTATPASPTTPTGSSGGVVKAAAYARRPPAARQVALKLREVEDALPDSRELVQRLRTLWKQVEAVANRRGYDVLYLPDDRLTEAEVAQALACCAEAVQQATFSAEYPSYCLSQARSERYPFVQGVVLRARRESVAPGRHPPHAHKKPADGEETQSEICAMVLSNGMDIYGNLKSTVTQIKAALSRGYLTPAMMTPHMHTCLGITDVSDMVHLTLSATHPRYRRRGLARLLMAIDMLRWALRGRSRAYLNMAVEKHLVDNGTRVEYAASAASRRLYESMGFEDVYPRYDPTTMEERWTAKEADMGRVMANLQFVPRMMEVAQRIIDEEEARAERK